VKFYVGALFGVVNKVILHIIFIIYDYPRGLVVCLVIMRFRVRFPVLTWEFSLKGRIPAVTMVWVGWYNLGLRAVLALHPPISPLTSSGQRNCASWASQPQKSVTLLPCPGRGTTKSISTCGGTRGLFIIYFPKNGTGYELLEL